MITGNTAEMERELLGLDCRDELLPEYESLFDKVVASVPDNSKHEAALAMRYSMAWGHTIECPRKASEFILDKKDSSYLDLMLELIGKATAGRKLPGIEMLVNVVDTYEKENYFHDILNVVNNSDEESNSDVETFMVVGNMLLKYAGLKGTETLIKGRFARLPRWKLAERTPLLAMDCAVDTLKLFQDCDPDDIAKVLKSVSETGKKSLMEAVCGMLTYFRHNPELGDVLDDCFTSVLIDVLPSFMKGPVRKLPEEKKNSLSRIYWVMDIETREKMSRDDANSLLAAYEICLNTAGKTYETNRLFIDTLINKLSQGTDLDDKLHILRTWSDNVYQTLRDNPEVLEYLRLEVTS